MAITVNVTNHNHDTRYGYSNAVGAFTDLTVTDNLTTGRLNDHTWYVDAADGGAGIQATIDEAAAGDVVLLGPGTFTLTDQQVVVDKSLTILGQGIRATTLDDESADGHAVSLSANDVELGGVSIIRTGSDASTTAGVLVTSSDAAAPPTGVYLHDLHITGNNTATGSIQGISTARGVTGLWRDITVQLDHDGTGAAYGLNIYQASSTTTASGPLYLENVRSRVNAPNCSVYCTGATLYGMASAAVNMTVFISPSCVFRVIDSTLATHSLGIWVVGSRSVVTVDGGVFGSHNGSSRAADIYRAAGSLTVNNATLLTGKPSGTITYAGRLQTANALFSAGIGVFGTEPPAARQTYSTSNVVATRTFDANTVTLEALADVVGTLIADQKTYGFIA